MKYIKRKLLNYLLKHLFNAITEDDILKISGNNVFIGNHLLPKQSIQSLVAEAEMFKNTELWKLLLNDGKREANKRMYEKSANYDDMYFGKAVLWIIDIFERKVDNIIKDFSKLNK